MLTKDGAMRKYFICILFLGLYVLGQLGHANTLRVGTIANYPPFTKTNQYGLLDGFDIALARAICQRLRMACKFIVYPWDELLPALNQHKVDIAIGAISITRARRRIVDFSDDYYSAPSSFITQPHRNISIDLHQLSQLRLGVENHSFQHLFLITYYRDKRLKLKLYPSILQGLTAIYRNEIDVFIGDTPPVQYWLQLTESHPNAKVTQQEPTQHPALYSRYGIAVSQGHQKLKKRLNRILRQLKNTRILQQLEQHYFTKL